MKTITRILIFISLSIFASSLFAQGTCFTYQGRLTASGCLASGNYDFTFALFATNASGTAIAGPITNASVAVSNGLFIAALDFGSNAFTGQSLWLEIGVRTNSAGAFTPLNARQQVTPTPYAIYAETAATVPAGSIGASQLAPGAIAFVPHNIQVFTNSGTWMNPSNVSVVYVKVIGGGGSGADSGGSSRPRGGGGGGGYAEGLIAVSGDAVVTIGPTNSFNGVTTIQATAGTDGSGFVGGVGGMGSGGSINLSGGAGQSETETVNGTGGMGGGSAMGTGGAGGALWENTMYVPATQGGAFGGGGGGATNLGNGAAGDPGAVIVYY